MAFEGKNQAGRGGKRRRPVRSKSVPKSRRMTAPRPANARRAASRDSASSADTARTRSTSAAGAVPARFGFLGLGRSGRSASRDLGALGNAAASRPSRRSARQSAQLQTQPQTQPQTQIQSSFPAKASSKDPSKFQSKFQPQAQKPSRRLQTLPQSSSGSSSGPSPLRATRHSRRPLRRKPRKPRPMVSALRYVMRLLIVGIGLGVLAGTVLSSIDPSLRYSGEGAKGPAQSSAAQSKTAAPNSSGKAATSQPKGLSLTREMAGLKSQLDLRITANTGLTAGVFIVDLDTGSYLDINARRRFSSASTIKLPILIALFEEVDAGNISLSDQLVMKPELISAEAGEMQFQPPGTQFSVLDTATEMIRVSDNTATNLLIDRLGGNAKLNQRFQSWGLQQTQIQSLLPDLEGTNTISPHDLVTLMGRINQGEIVSLRSRDRLLGILRTTQTNDLLPQGIGPGASIAHKTGNIGKAVGDVGLIDMPSGKRYIIMAMVERPAGDVRAEDLIRSISSETYQFLEATGSTSEQMPPTLPRANIAEQEPPKTAPSIMTTDP